MSALDRVQMSDLDEEQQQVAELIGLDNYKELAGRYGLTEVRIRSIVSDKMREFRARPMDGQQSLF